MSYNKTTWADGDTITAEKMNNIEDGIEDASGGGGGIFVINTLDYDDDDGTVSTADKTYAQITSALSAGSIPVVCVKSSGGTLYYVCYYSRQIPSKVFFTSPKDSGISKSAYIDVNSSDEWSFAVR